MRFLLWLELRLWEAKAFIGQGAIVWRSEDKIYVTSPAVGYTPEGARRIAKYILDAADRADREKEF